MRHPFSSPTNLLLSSIAVLLGPATTSAQRIDLLGRGCGSPTTQLDAYGSPSPGVAVEVHISKAGDTLTFDVSPSTRLTSVVMMGTGCHTHRVEAGVPRRLELAVQQAGKAATVLLPTDVNRLPVGHYPLFGMVDDIPSVARIVRVRG